MPTEIYIAIIVTASCILFLTISFLFAAVYLMVRVSSIERQVTQLEGALSGLIYASHKLVHTSQHIVSRATGAMDDVGRMTRTAAGWSDRANRMINVVATATEPPREIVYKCLQHGSGFLSGVMQALRTPRNKS